MADNRNDLPNDFDEELDKRADAAPWDNVPKDMTLPEQLYEWEIIDGYGGRTAGSNNTVAKFKYVLVLECLAPAEFKGRQQIENFTIGTDTDPLAERNETWFANPSFGLVNLNILRAHHGVDKPKALIGKRFAAFTRNSGDAGGGRMYTNLQFSKIFHIGEMPAGTATPATTRGRRNNALGASQATPDANAPVACPICAKSFTQADIGDHVQNCRG